MAYYNEYELIQLKNNDGEPIMPRSTPKAVVFADGETLEEKWNSGGEGTGKLTSSITANVEIGSVTNGKTYPAGTSLETIIRDMLVKSVAPSNTISYTPSTKIYNIVEDSLSELTIKTTVTKGTSDISKIEFYVNNVLVNTVTEDVAAGGTFSYDHTFSPAVNSNISLKVIVTDADDATSSSTATIKFVGKSYYGIVSETVSEPTETDIKGLEFNSLKDTKTLEFKNIEIPQDGSLYKVVYAYPKSFGAITKIVDGNNFNYFDSYTKSEVTVDNIVYYCYILNEGTGTSGSTQIFS